MGNPSIRSLFKMRAKVVMFIVGAITVLSGCTSQMRTPKEVCPGKDSVAEALAALGAQALQAVPLKASGQCRLEFPVEGKKKPQKENVDIGVRVNPPYDIFLWGDKPLASKAVVLGSNEQEFWLAIRPKISFYGWGKWSEQGSVGGPIIDPRTLLEAFGMSGVDAQKDWSLSNEGAFDILTRRDRGVVTKKIHIYSCKYQVSKIELFNSAGQVTAFAELDSYEEVSEGCYVPAWIQITTVSQDEARDPLTITLTLKSIRSHGRWPDLIFERKPPPPGRFKNMGVVVNGKWIEQPQ
jgi:hypothetical protein